MTLQISSLAFNNTFLIIYFIQISGVKDFLLNDNNDDKEGLLSKTETKLCRNISQFQFSIPSSGTNNDSVGPNMKRPMRIFRFL